MVFKKVGLLSLATFLVLAGLLLDAVERQGDVGLRSRQVTFGKNQGDRIGTIDVDFYRPFKRGLLGMKKYSITRFRCRLLVRYLNYWYGGRIQFNLGDIYDLDDPSYYRVPLEENPCDLMDSFTSNGGVKNTNHLSVVAANRLLEGPGLLACASNPESPLGSISAPPATIFAAGTATSVFGASLAHSIGHIIGFEHTTTDRDEGVNTYFGCGLDLKYPFWQNDKLLDGSVTDGETTFNQRDWKGRTNIMARYKIITLIQGFAGFQMGVYRSGYASVFEQITECWFSQDERQSTAARP